MELEVKTKQKVKKHKVFGDKKCDFTYTFQRKMSDLPKKNKELYKLDSKLLESLKLCHYIPCITYLNIITKLDSLMLCKWYHCSLSLSYLYDNNSVKAYTFFKSYSDNLDIYIDYLYQDFLDYCISVKGMKRLHKGKIKIACEWFVVNLNRAKLKSKLGIIYHRSQETYLQLKEEYGADFPYNVMKKLIEFLEHKGLVINLTGYNLDKGEGDPVLSALILSEGLDKYTDTTSKTLGKDIIDPVQLAMCQVRDENKNSLPILKEWEDVIKSSDELILALNNMYRETEIRVNGQIVPDIILTRIWTGDIFNCGRFFDKGQYQQFDKKSRATTEIEGETACFFDFDSLHPSLLYELEGITLDKDPYPVLTMKVQKVLVNKFKKYHEHGKYNPVRNLCKLVMLCMINASSRESAISAVVQKLYLDRAKIGNIKREQSVKYCGLPMNPAIGQIMDIIISENKPIEKYFYTGIGLRLMNYDSRILEYVLTKAVETKTVIIPLHDEAICKKSDKVNVKKWLQEGYLEVMGSNLNCNIGEE